jgi:hypothetical protein
MGNVIPKLHVMVPTGNTAEIGSLFPNGINLQEPWTVEIPPVQAY